MYKFSSALVAGLAILSSGVMARTPDLPSCDIWQTACHYTNSDREATYNINRVVIHKTEGGSAAGASSWFANCASGGSAHFVFEKVNGQCYQCVLEADVAWHAGYSSTNNNSVGLEHSGWTANNDTSTACYNESAIETKSCVTYYAVPGNRTYIIGHSEVPGCSGYGGGSNCHTDPGSHWNWSYYIAQVNGGSTPPPPPPPSLPTYTIDNASAGFSVVGTWSTGSSAGDKYGADYRFKSTAPISEPASWAVNVTDAGTYKVQAWWTAGSNRSAAAPYVVPNGSSVAKNQQAGGGAWNTLGTYSLAVGTQTTKLSCWAKNLHT
jgi:N-acetyl-anhydromuramyl-L-alanine amidase AmpD